MSRECRVAYLVGKESVELRRVPVPEPGRGELLVRIGAATTCGTDVKVFRRGGHPRMLRPPCPFGHELAGTIAACGEGTDGWVPGDRVVVANSASCGACRPCERGRENLCEDLVYLNGAFAECILVPPRFVARSTYPIADSLDFDLAALAEPLACVLHGVEMCRLDAPAAAAVVYGAGPIGLLFTAVLAHRGHGVVVADPHPARLETARALGAMDTVCIARGGSQSALAVERSPDPKGFDLAVDATGLPAVWSDALRSVQPGGLVNLFGGCPPGTEVPLDTHGVHYGEITIQGVYHHRPANVREALELLTSGALDVRRLLSAARPLEDVVGALRSMMRKEALKVVIRP